MTIDTMIDGILKREGGYVDHPDDRGGPTHFGITAKTLGSWRGLSRDATRAEVKNLTEAEARRIYTQRYVKPFDVVPFDEIRTQLVDIGVHSGPAAAVRLLQQALGVPVDGILGPRTTAALLNTSWPVTNNAIAALRMRQFVRIVEHDPSQRTFFWGWCRRAVQFVV